MGREQTAIAAVDTDLLALVGTVGREVLSKPCRLVPTGNVTRPRRSVRRFTASRISWSVASRHPYGPDNPSRVLAYAAWWKASGWRLRLSEAMLVNPMMGYGGTLDLLAYDRDGRTVLADIKTGKGVYQEAVLQLTAYGMAELINRPATT